MLCCERRAPVPVSRETTSLKWERLCRGLRRLTHVRRLWATLGHWLRVVKERGTELGEVAT